MSTLSRRAKWLNHLEIGSRVAVVTRGNVTRSTIVRSTKRYWVTAANARFRREDGRAPGDYTWGEPYLDDPDREDVRRGLHLADLRRTRYALRAALESLDRAPEDVGAAELLAARARMYLTTLEGARYYAAGPDEDKGETND